MHTTPSTLDLGTLCGFLEQLEAHNTRERMHAHQEEYKASKGITKNLAQWFITNLTARDPLLGEIDVEETIFRLARDTRFGKDKSPYKTNIGIVIAPGGKKSIFPCYYLHIQPGNHSFLAVGLYRPEGAQQTAVREYLLAHWSVLQNILTNKDFIDTRGHVSGDAYKRMPVGYPHDHPAGSLFQQKDRLVQHPLSDRTVLSDTFLTSSIHTLLIATPLRIRLHQAILQSL